MIFTSRWLALLAISSAFTLPALAQENAVEAHRRALQEAVADPTDKSKVEALIKTLVEHPSGSGRYIVEGDISIAREEIVPYLLNLKTPNLAKSKSNELIVNVVGGKLDYLVRPEKRKLTYSFEAQTFPTPASLQFTKEKLRKAADDWVAACPECKISFTEVSSNAYFKVRYDPLNDGTVAMAFFPSSPPTQRILFVYAPFISPDLEFDPAGVLRHELGHVLGYRHEHIVNIPGCATEGGSWKQVTPYTPNSVMHYFCGGKGSFDMSLRKSDKDGHRCVYMTGKPCPSS